MRKSTSGSRGFETTGKTTEAKPTDMLFEKAKVPEIPTRPTTGTPGGNEIGNTPCRDRRSGSSRGLSKLCGSYLNHRCNARRCGSSGGGGDACAQGEVREGPEVEARPRRWHQAADGRWRARRLTIDRIDEQLDQDPGRQANDRTMDGDRQGERDPGLEADHRCGQEGRPVHGSAMLRESQYDTPSDTPRQRLQGELHVRGMPAADAVHSEARGHGGTPEGRTARTDGGPDRHPGDHEGETTETSTKEGAFASTGAGVVRIGGLF